jgi:hypothetical protein
MPTPTPKQYGFGKVKSTFDLELPSLSDPDDPNSEHNVVKVRRPGVQGLMKAGVLDSFDSLTAFVQTEHIERADGKAEFKAEQAAKKQDQKSLLQDDPKKIIEALSMIDKVVLHCVVEPKLSPAPEREEDRDADTLYVDEVDLDDRMFILNFALGGSRDLETFRERSSGGVAGVAAQQNVPVSAE